MDVPAETKSTPKTTGVLPFQYFHTFAFIFMINIVYTTRTAVQEEANLEPYETSFSYIIPDVVILVVLTWITAYCKKYYDAYPVVQNGKRRFMLFIVTSFDYILHIYSTKAATSISQYAQILVLSKGTFVYREIFPLLFGTFFVFVGVYLRLIE